MKTTKKPKDWMTYEQVAAYLLNEFANEFGLEHVQGKQKVTGNSGTEWEIDGKGYNDNGSAFIVVECKRHTKAGISQALTGSLAYTMSDLDATGGIFVSVKGFQDGAKLVAEHENIIEVKLNENSTTTAYIMTFLNQICMGEKVSVSDHGFIELNKPDGTIIKTTF